MMSTGITLRISDSHAIVDLETGRQVNPQADIRIGRHVWIGQDVVAMKGVRVGDGAILAARALATRDVPACSLVGGTPARMPRQRVSWTREATAKPATVAALLAEFGSHDAVAEPANA